MHKIFVRLFALEFRQRSVRSDFQAVPCEFRQDFIAQHVHLIGHHRRETIANLAQLIGRGQTIWRRLEVSVFDLLLQARHAHHKKLINDVRKNRDEAQPFEHWIALVMRFIQHLTEKLDQAKFTIEQLRLRARCDTELRTHRLGRGQAFF
jgi:hypothetical protein